MRIGNKGSIGVSTITDYVILFVMLIVLFLVVAQLYPTGVEAGNTLNASGAPLGSLFASGGVVWLVIFAAILIAIVIGVLAKIKGKK